MITLYKDRKMISIDDTDEITAAQFALWFRTLILGQYKLYLCHDSGGEELVEITPSSTEVEIADSLGNL